MAVALTMPFRSNVVKPLLPRDSVVGGDLNGTISEKTVESETKSQLVRVYSICIVSTVLTVIVTIFSSVFDSINIEEDLQNTNMLKTTFSDIGEFVTLSKGLVVGSIFCDVNATLDALTTEQLQTFITNKDNYRTQLCNLGQNWESLSMCNSTLSGTNHSLVEDASATFDIHQIYLQYSKVLQMTKHLDMSYIFLYKLRYEIIAEFLLDILACSQVSKSIVAMPVYTSHFVLKTIDMKYVTLEDYNISVITMNCAESFTDISNTSFHNYVSHLLSAIGVFESELTKLSSEILASIESHLFLLISRVIALCILALFISCMLLVVLQTTGSFNRLMRMHSGKPYIDTC